MNARAKAMCKELPLFNGPEPFALVAEDAIDGERIKREKRKNELSHQVTSDN
jgi:hypothetical protein